MRSREFLDAARGGMQAQLQLIEGESVADWNDELAIQHEAFRGQPSHCLDHVRKIARQWLTGLRLQKDFVTVTKSETAESVPFWFVLPVLARWKFVDRARLHRWKRRLQI